MAKRMNDKEMLCLKMLAENYHSEWGDGAGFTTFQPIIEETKLTRKEVRRAVRSLAKKELTKYSRGLWNDDGPAGAGYACTEEGYNLVGTQLDQLEKESK